MGFFSRNKKAKKEDRSVVPIFHGSNSVIRPEDFDYSKANPQSDFGIGAYFSYKYANARRWASKKDPGIVNTYVFHEEDARNDPNIVIEEFDNDLDWLNRIISIYLGLEEPNSIIFGKIMDGHTILILGKYEELARRMGKNLLTMDDSYKMAMIKELKPDRIGEQIVFRRKEDLKHVEYIDSVEVSGMDYPRIVDPSEIAADVAIKLSIRDGITRNDALIAFMRSNTFRRVLEDESMCDMDTEEILEIYRREVDARV